MELHVRREPSIDTPRGRTTFGALSIDDHPFTCRTLEDQLRADPDPSTPRNEAKVYGETAIPPGRYELKLRDSPKFGKDKLWVTGVPGYELIMIHSGVDVDSTLGCLIVGASIDREKGIISGGKLLKVLEKLEAVVVPHLKAGGQAFITYHDPEVA